MPIYKVSGDMFGAIVTFKHRGVAEKGWVGIGLANHVAAPGQEGTAHTWRGSYFDIPAGPDWETYSVTVGIVDLTASGWEALGDEGRVAWGAGNGLSHDGTTWVNDKTGARMPPFTDWATEVDWIVWQASWNMGWPPCNIRAGENGDFDLHVVIAQGTPGGSAVSPPTGFKNEPNPTRIKNLYDKSAFWFWGKSDFADLSYGVR